ncbi:oligosaccharide flippase family protein [Acidipila sp. EB88]|uniref:oligosaccharide flippase family protein n=1 Tax=Acidipila sp. EB88 TaxID=2305226 RepID=UPI00131542A1|nr:oligosaccharide flippase family protein [Acidipila sp. EB88]
MSGPADLRGSAEPLHDYGGLAAGDRLRHQATWLLSGSGASVIFQALYFSCMGRMLGAQEYGAFVGAVALVSVLSQFSSLGMEMVLLRTIARDRAAFGATWTRALLVSTAGFVLVLAVAMLYGKLFLPLTLRQLLPYLVVSDALFGKLTQLASRAFQGAGLARWSAKLAALTNAARAGAAITLFVWAARAHRHVVVLLWVRLYLVAALLVAIFSLVLVSRLLGSPVPAAIRRSHLLEGLSFAFSNSSISVYNDIDKTLLASHGMLADAGIYTAAYRVLDVASTPVYSLFAAASPRLFRVGSASGAEGVTMAIRDLLRWVVAFGVAAALLLVITAPAVPLLFGHSFGRSVSALRFLCLLPLLRGLHYAWGTAITACTSQWLRTAAQAFAAGLNLLLNLLLIPHWGWRGAAFTSLVSDGALALCSFLILQVLLRRQHARGAPAAKAEAEASNTVAG